MREFTDSEKLIIEKMVSAREIRGLSLIKLIDENTDAVAFEWNLVEPNFKIFYSPSNLTEDELFNLFNQVQEIVFLLKNLEEDNLIYLHKNEKITENRLYNQEIFKRDDAGNYFKISFPVNLENAIGYQLISGPYKINTDFGNYVRHYAIALFYVSNALRDLVRNNYKTPEQLRFEEQLRIERVAHTEAMRNAQEQVNNSRLAFYSSIAAFALAFTFGLIQSCSDTKIDKEQFNQIKQTIMQKTIPDVINAKIINDTLIMKTFEKLQTQSNNK